jgi:hypothetical protein
MASETATGFMTKGSLEGWRIGPAETRGALAAFEEDEEFEAFEGVDVDVDEADAVIPEFPLLLPLLLLLLLLFVDGV